nr:MAG TPA: hypothetical protein [Caudoviricetes sp.]
MREISSFNQQDFGSPLFLIEGYTVSGMSFLCYFHSCLLTSHRKQSISCFKSQFHQSSQG